MLDKAQGRRDPEIEHSPEGYCTYYTANVFETIVSGIQEYLRKRFQDFYKTLLKQMVKIFDFKSWPKAFNGSLAERKWGLKEVQEMARRVLPFFQIYGRTRREIGFCFGNEISS